MPIKVCIVEANRGTRESLSELLQRAPALRCVGAHRDAMRALWEFGADAKPAVPSLRRLLTDEQESIRSDATNTLRIIEAATQTGVK